MSGALPTGTLWRFGAQPDSATARRMTSVARVRQRASIGHGPAAGIRADRPSSNPIVASRRARGERAGRETRLLLEQAGEIVRVGIAAGGADLLDRHAGRRSISLALSIR